MDYYTGLTNTLAVDMWVVTFGTARGAWAGCGPAQSPPRSTKCNSPPRTPTNGSVSTSYYSTWHYNYLCTLKS